MSNRGILIAYGTRFGSTREVCEYVAKIFRDKGFEPSLLDTVETPVDRWPSPRDYDGVVVASSIKRGAWLQQPMTFLERNKVFFSGDKPLGVFVCCATAAKSHLRPRALNEYVEVVLKRLGVHPSRIDAFGGVIDFSANSRKNWVDKKIVGFIHRNDQAVTKGVRNDMRDWAQIGLFAADFIAAVKHHERGGSA